MWWPKIYSQYASFLYNFKTESSRKINHQYENWNTSNDMDIVQRYTRSDVYISLLAVHLWNNNRCTSSLEWNNEFADMFLFITFTVGS